MRHCVTVVVLALLFGCGTAPLYQLPDPAQLASAGSSFDGAATVYVFRGPEAPTRPVNISIDGTLQGAIKKKTYVLFAAPPGTHVLLASPPLEGAEPKVSVAAALEGGKTYYFMLDTKFSFNAGGSELTSNLTQIDAATAADMLRTYRQAPARGKQPTVSQ